MPYKNRAWTKLKAMGEHGPHQLYIGVELEVEAAHVDENCFPDDDEDKLYDLVRAVDLTNPDLWNYGEDGSLDCGVEFKTMPFTQGYYRSGAMNLPEAFAALKGKAKPYNIDNEYTAGVHIHMSRTGFTEEHLERFIQFHYKNKKFCQMVAGREAECYASFDFREHYDQYGGWFGRRKSDRELFKDIAQGNYRGHNRYMAVNLEPRETIELRYFVSTCKLARFEGYIQWAFALHEYTKSPVNKLSGSAFRAWLSNRPDYDKAYALTRRQNQVERPAGVSRRKIVVSDWQTP